MTTKAIREYILVLLFPLYLRYVYAWNIYAFLQNIHHSGM